MRLATRMLGLPVQGKSLHLTRASGLWGVTDNGKEPSEWKVVPYATVGTSEEFIEFFSGELLELVDASNIHGADRDKLKDSIMTILTEGLMPAFEHLRKIRSAVVSAVPELNRKHTMRILLKASRVPNNTRRRTHRWHAAPNQVTGSRLHSNLPKTQIDLTGQ